MTVKELIQNVEDLKVHLNEVSVYETMCDTMNLHGTLEKLLKKDTTNEK